jgi:hypothetical protein
MDEVREGAILRRHVHASTSTWWILQGLRWGILPALVPAGCLHPFLIVESIIAVIQAAEGLATTIWYVGVAMSLTLHVIFIAGLLKVVYVREEKRSE